MKSGENCDAEEVAICDSTRTTTTTNGVVDFIQKNGDERVNGLLEGTTFSQKLNGKPLDDVSVEEGDKLRSGSQGNDQDGLVPISTPPCSTTSGGDERLDSLEHVLRSELYLKQTKTDFNGRSIPFPLLQGESVEALESAGDCGTFALSNYRLFILHRDSFVNIPIGLIESVEYREIFHLHIFCKDARTLRCTFPVNDVCLDWFKRLVNAIRLPRKFEDTFAFQFNAWCMEAARKEGDINAENRYRNAPSRKMFDTDVKRLGFNLKTAWRITYINENYSTCGSYPAFHVVPKSVTDEELKKIANFRSSHRFPSVVWRDVNSGAVLVRSSQPEVGWFGWRNAEDENFPKAIVGACALDPGPAALRRRSPSCLSQTDGMSRDSGDSTADNSVTTACNGSAVNGMNGGVSAAPVGGSPPPSNSSSPIQRNMLLIDARSYTAAVANRTKGGGYEFQEYYPNCDIMFMSLANIHAIRKSFFALRTLCAMSADTAGWLTNLDNTKWLQNVSALLRASLVVVNAIDKDHKPVLVHCSDGWDRTPQIVSLAELMLDPYYRSIQGFQVLIEREWVEFGHRFADRCNQGVAVDDPNERCPVFIQWLDCVHQLTRQFPCAFQFNDTYLVKLVQHTYSCLFGDFLCNSVKERNDKKVQSSTLSVWTLLGPSCHQKYVNQLYPANGQQQGDRVLHPVCQMQNIRLWEAVYLADNSLLGGGGSGEDLSAVQPTTTSSSSTTDSPDGQLPVKTRSCEDLTKLTDVGVGGGGSGGGVGGVGMSPGVCIHARRLSDPSIAGGGSGGGGVSPMGGTEKGLLDRFDHVSGGTGGSVGGGEVERIDRYDSIDAWVGGSEGVGAMSDGDMNRFPSKETLKAADCDGDDDYGEKELSRREPIRSSPSVGGASVEPTNQNRESAPAILKCNDCDTNEHEHLAVEAKPALWAGLSSSLIGHSECEDSSDTLTGIDDVMAFATPTLEDKTSTPCDTKGCAMNDALKELSQVRVRESEIGADDLDSSSIENGSRLLNNLINGRSTNSSVMLNSVTTTMIISPGQECPAVTMQHAAAVQSGPAMRSTPGLPSSTFAPGTGISTQVFETSTLAQRASAVAARHNMTHLANTVGGAGPALRPVAPPLVLRMEQNGGSVGGDSEQSMSSVESSSSKPTTPVEECRWAPPWSPRGPASGGLNRHLDWDGLTSHSNAVQLRTAQIKSEYEQRVRYLESQLGAAREKYKDVVCKYNTLIAVGGGMIGGVNGYLTVADCKDELASADSCERGSACSGSTVASDMSWERLEEKEAQMTLWVPDHVVTHCADCDEEFSWIIRRHHCRKCGQVFCNDCTKFNIPVPQQQLNCPVRVCRKCYQSVCDPQFRPLCGFYGAGINGGEGVVGIPSDVCTKPCDDTLGNKLHRPSASNSNGVHCNGGSCVNGNGTSGQSNNLY